MTAPASFRRDTTVASIVGLRPACSTVPSSVGMSPVSMMSLMPTGTPCSGPVGRPFLPGEVRIAGLAKRMLLVEKGPRLHPRLVGANAGQAAIHQLFR